MENLSFYSIVFVAIIVVVMILYLVTLLKPSKNPKKDEEVQNPNVPFNTVLPNGSVITEIPKLQDYCFKYLLKNNKRDAINEMSIVGELTRDEAIYLVESVIKQYNLTWSIKHRHYILKQH